MKHNYQENKDKRKDNAKKGIARNEKAAEASFGRAREIGSHIPLGQPILIGHHSEKRHRMDLEKIENNMRNGVSALNKATYYAERLEAMESNTAISSDDPEAIPKLEKKLALLEQMQAFMKAANKCIKKKDKEAFLQLDSGTEELWVKLNTPDCFKETGYGSYRLTNNNANIRRIRERIAGLKQVAGRVTEETVIKGVRFVQNTAANRVQLIFPDKPSEPVRETLRRYRFHFSYTENAWQRFLNNAGLFAAKTFLENYTQE